MAFTPKFEQFANDARTFVDTGIDDTVTSLILDSADSFPTVGNFRIAVNAEIMLVTAISGKTLTVIERGVEGTTAAAHSAGDVVTGIVTAAAIEQMAKDYTPLWKITPQLGSLVGGSGNDLQVSDFTWVNQGSATVTDIQQGIKVTIPRTVTISIRALVMSAPTAPYTITAVLGHSNTAPRGSTDLPWVGLGFREASSSKLSNIRVHGNGISITNYTNPTTVSSTPLNIAYYTKQVDLVYFKIEDDNTNIKYFFSNNGDEWLELHSEARGSFFSTAPTQVGFFMNGVWPTAKGNETDHDGLLLHWSEG